MRLIEIDGTVFNPDAIDIIQADDNRGCTAKFRGGEEGQFACTPIELGEKIRKAMGAY
jgi:hypothetical protein